MKPRRPQAIPFERLRSKVRAALGASGRPAPTDAGDLAAASPDLIQSLPGWVGRFGWLASPESFALWCEPRRRRGETFPSQVVLDLPPGRYFVDALDVRSNEWISRESAEGGPLVAGLPFTGRPILLWIRAFNV